MTPLPILGALLELAEYQTHWPALRWVSYGLGLVGQVLAVYYWRKARKAPIPVLYGCRCCHFIGDQPALEGHRCRQ